MRTPSERPVLSLSAALQAAPGGMLSQEGRLQACRLQCGVWREAHPHSDTCALEVQTHSIVTEQATVCLHPRNSAGTSWPGGLAVEQFAQLVPN